MAEQQSPSRKCLQCSLVPINLHDPAEFDIMRQHRIKCGWNHNDEVISSWRDKVDAKIKSFFWITLPPSTTDGPPIKAGHISLDSLGEAPDPDFALANPDKSLLTISTFFIDPMYRGGLGRTAMEMLEKMAREEPYGSVNCKAIAVFTLSRWYTNDDEGRKVWEMLGGETPVKQSSSDDWYRRMGMSFLSTFRYKVI